jgi:hypothetical protein
MLKLMEAAMVAGLAFEWNPEVGAFEANDFRVTILDTLYRVKDLTGGVRNDAYMTYPADVVKYIELDGCYTVGL